jgi:hypothetical protein
LFDHTTGSFNTAVGHEALQNNTTANNNTGVGYQALNANSTGASNTAVGWSSMKDNTTGANNVAFGQSALQENTTANANAAFGYRALYLNTTGATITAVGYRAGYNSTSGNGSTLVGANAGYSLTTSAHANTFVGSGGWASDGAGYAVTTGTRNTILGGYTGNQGGLDIRTSDNNIVLSDGDGNPRIQVDGNGVFKVPYVYSDTNGSAANVHIASDGRFYRSTSSQRYKNTITDATHGLTELLALRPVTYKGNNNGDTIFGGLIAEEVHDAGLTEFVEYDDEGRPDALAYGNMVSLCIKAIQEQQATITALEARIATLESN